MDPDEHPTWCYLEIDEPLPDPAELPGLVDVDQAYALELVDPVDLQDIRPGPIDWAAIRTHAERLGFPVDARPVDELTARRRHNAARPTQTRRRRRRRPRYAKGA
jgi:hypothetical protein